MAYFIGGYFFAFLWGFVTEKVLKIDHFARQKGFHFHHSVFGLIGIPVAIFVLFYYKNTELFFNILIFSGGVIVEHTLTKDGFVFITKD